jgi:hypothetical protein
MKKYTEIAAESILKYDPGSGSDRWRSSRQIFPTKQS